MRLANDTSTQCLRCFSSSFPRSRHQNKEHLAKILNIGHEKLPPYPYGPAILYKQADSGLYGGARVQVGNKVSSKNEIKTRRRWHPNIHNKRLWSQSLQQFVPLKVQARVLRTIDKVGGLDEYLLGDKPARVKELGLTGWSLRWRIMQTEAVKSKFQAERQRLGLVTGAARKQVLRRKRKAAAAAQKKEEEQMEADERFVAERDSEYFGDDSARLSKKAPSRLARTDNDIAKNAKLESPKARPDGLRTRAEQSASHPMGLIARIRKMLGI